MRRSGLLFLAALALLSTACPKRVIVGGQEMAEPEANALARAEMERLRAQAAGMAPERAAEAWEQLAARFGDASAAADALYEAALQWRAARRLDRAVADLGQLLTRFPLASVARDAKYQLGLVQLEAGRARDAYQTLANLYDKLPRDRQLAAARAVADAAEAARLWPNAVRWRAEAAAQMQGADRDREVARAVEMVDGRLSFLEVARLAEELPRDSLALPAVTMKLARIYVHLHDYDQAAAQAREEISRWPDGPWAADARTLLDRLARRGQVNPNVIGVAVPLSGKFKGWGDAILAGVGLAVADVPGVKIVAKDTRGEPDGAAQALEDLAVGEGAIAVVGGVANAEAARASALAQELEIPLLSLSKVEGVTEAGPFVFRVMLTASAQASALAEFAFARRGMRRFAILYPDIPYGVELANAFWDEVDARGGEVRAAESYEHDRTTFSPLVKDMVGKRYLDERTEYVEKMKELGKAEKDPYRLKKARERLQKELEPVVDFDAIFIPDFAKNLALVAPALAVEDVVTSTCDPREVERIKKASGRTEVRAVQLLGGNGWDDPALFEKAGKYVECAVFVDGFFAGSERPETKRFTEAFLKRYGYPPSILEASAYDATRMVRQLVEKDRVTTREGLRDGLAGMKGFKGATGDLSFDARREPARALFFLTVDRTGLREMRPEELLGTGAGGP